MSLERKQNKADDAADGGCGEGRKQYQKRGYIPMWRCIYGRDIWMYSGGVMHSKRKLLYPVSRAYPIPRGGRVCAPIHVATEAKRI